MRGRAMTKAKTAAAVKADAAKATARAANSDDDATAGYFALLNSRKAQSAYDWADPSIAFHNPILNPAACLSLLRGSSDILVPLLLTTFQNEPPSRSSQRSAGVHFFHQRITPARRRAAASYFLKG